MIGQKDLGTADVLAGYEILSSSSKAGGGALGLGQRGGSGVPASASLLQRQIR